MEPLGTEVLERSIFKKGSIVADAEVVDQDNQSCYGEELSSQGKQPANYADYAGATRTIPGCRQLRG